MKITDEALKAASELGDRYIADRFLPDKAIDLVDEAASKMRIKTMSSPPYFKEVDDELAEVRAEKEAAIDGQEYEKAARLRDNEKQLALQRRELEKSWREDEDGEDQAASHWGERDRRDRLYVDRHPGKEDDRGGVRASPEDGGLAARACRRTGRGHKGRLPVHPPGLPPAFRTRIARVARSCSSGPRASVRRSLRGRSPSTCSAIRIP